MLEWIGWLATATFASSYFSAGPPRCSVLQALAAVAI